MTTRALLLPAMVLIVGILGLACGIVIGYRFGRDGDGTQYVLPKGATVEYGGRKGALPPGTTIYGVRDRLAEKVGTYKAYFVMYDSNAVPIERASTRDREHLVIQP